jgi:hypothetical protein
MSKLSNVNMFLSIHDTFIGKVLLTHTLCYLQTQTQTLPQLSQNPILYNNLPTSQHPGNA